VTNDNQLYGNPHEGDVVFKLTDMNSGSKVVTKMALLQKLNI
jgi:hypothetical protein